MSILIIAQGPLAMSTTVFVVVIFDLLLVTTKFLALPMFLAYTLCYSCMKKEDSKVVLLGSLNNAVAVLEFLVL